MTRKEAIQELDAHVRQCEALMPKGWQESHGENSDFRKAIGMAKKTLESIPPCNIGDVLWGIRSYRGARKIVQGIVSEMFYTKDMGLCIVLRSVCRGRYGEKVFATREEAEIGIKQRAGGNLTWI